MKMLKLMLGLGSILVANAIYAVDASVTSASVSYGTDGYVEATVAGSNGTYKLTKTGTSGTVSPVTAVTHVANLTLVAESGGGYSNSSTCTLVVPEGATATLQYSASRTNISVASASASINGVTYTATYTTPVSGTLTLPAGTYTLLASSSCQVGTGGAIAVIGVGINY
jgi:hypothetical protein